MRGSFLSIRVLLTVGAALLALLLVAGCGDSDDSATGSSGGSEEITVETGSLSKAAFIKQVEPICRKATEKFESQLEKAFGESTEKPRKPTEPSAVEEYYETDFPETYENQIDEISALGAPKGDEQEIATYLEIVQKGVDEAREDFEGFNQSFLENQGAFDGTAKLTAAYGLRGCS